MTNVKKVDYWKIITWIVFAIVILFAVAAILAKLSIGGVRFLTVQSGSMEPAIKTGSLIITKSENNYYVNDIITYKSIEKPNEKITHRIVELSTDNGTVKYRTKGDANSVPDEFYVLQDNVVGKVVLKVPYIGYPIGFSRTVPGLIIIIIVPATIIVYDEISKIKKEIADRKKAKKATVKTTKNKGE
ncbi:MAG: signal peptidase I [Patescibacteria group bacterium]|jgi:signal peptidase